ncbi:indolepyruvate ferredoxin oxidoreductase alpha subunit [Desulfitispora alkaliphila]|uniref:indolepyruvate ferredoxin oxidoreductase subunit alpha n=1 Tax=Desulfitispora alkaliphila TaxID=622674 RepID=UPI003D2151DE
MKKLLTGNEAIARGAWEAGVTVAAAYPGTPSTEITENVATYSDIYAEWSPNEKVALEVGIGASIAGARTLVCMKHVGVNVAADPLFTFAYTGVNGGLVLVSADDPGMHSSQNEQDTRHLARAAKVPVIEPSDSSEAKELLKLAFQISEDFDTPVIFRITTRVAHSQTLVELGERENFELKEYKKDPLKYVMVPAYGRARHVVVEDRKARLAQFAEGSELNTIEWAENKAVGVITNGISYQYAKEAFGEKVSVLKLGMTYPLPKNLISKFVETCEQVYVAEELEPFIENEIKAMGIKVTGKELLPTVGELSAKMLQEKIKIGSDDLTQAEAAVATEEVGYQIEGNAPIRPPVMCAGCPHRGAYHVFRKLKLKVAGDIGCYTLGAMAPLESIDTCICMGASIGNALGMEKARGKDFAKKLISVIGDSTFLHSGVTGLIDMVYNQGIGTVVILDNSTTAMTGHQHHPGTGKSVTEQPAPQIDFVKLVEAVGIKRVRNVDPYDLEGLEEIMKEELEAEEPSVVIAKRACALIDKGSWTNPISINADACVGCRQCIRLGCPGLAVSGKKTVCNETQCIGCGLCIKVCKFGAIKVGEGNE